MATDNDYRSAPQYISVSERLPGPKDCDVDGRCWWWCTDGPAPAWMLCTDAEGWSRWLPYHDLPVPTPATTKAP